MASSHLPPPLVEDDIINNNHHSPSSTQVENSNHDHHQATSPISSDKNNSNSPQQQQEFDIASATTGTTGPQRHFARLCSILSDPSVDEDTISMTLRRGVPDELRIDFWKLVLGVLPLGDPGKREKTMKEMNEQYEQLLELTCKDIKDGGDPDEEKQDPFPIDADIPRTMPTLHFFASPAHHNSSKGVFEQNLNSIKQEEVRNDENEKDQDKSTSTTTDDTATVVSSPHSLRTDRYGRKSFTPAQLALRRVLFLYSRVHRGRSYAQGMNEQVGLLLWAACNGNASQVNNVEAEVFFCFQSLMQWCGDHFSSIEDHHGDTGLSETLKTYNFLLKLCDPELHQHLDQKCMIAPEYYAFRWISILFAVEFPVADVLSLWDFMLSFTDKVSIAALFVAVAMLVNIREKLLEGDTGSCLEMLQNYPPQIEVSDILATSQALIDRYTVHPHLWGSSGKVVASGTVSGNENSGGTNNNNNDNDDDNENNNNENKNNSDDDGISFFGKKKNQGGTVKSHHATQHDTSDDDDDDVGKKISEGATAAMNWLSTKANSFFNNNNKKENSSSSNETGTKN